MGIRMKIKYESVEQLQEAIDDYFKTCDNNKQPYTVCDLALHLGFLSRQSVYDYANGKSTGQKKFTYTVKTALFKIEAYAERHLYSNHVTGAIFALKNRGWTDKHQVEHSGDVSIVRMPVTSVKVINKDADQDNSE